MQLNTIKRIIKNAGVMLLAKTVSPVFSFLIIIFVARYLGVSGLGKLSTVLSIFFIFQTISNLGLEHLITKEVSRDREKADIYLINASLISIVFALLIVGVMCLTGFVLNYSADTTNALYLISLALIPASLSSVCQSICRAFEKHEYVGISLILESLFKMIISLLVLQNGCGLLTLIVVILGSHLLGFILSVYYASKCIHVLRYKIDIPFCKYLIESVPTFAFIFVFSTLYWNVDMIMLSKMQDTTAVGFYSAAYKLMNVWKVVPISFLMAVQPLLAISFVSSYNKFKTIFEKSIKYFLIVTLPVAVGTTILAEDILYLLYKDQFAASSDVLRILIWTLVPLSVVLVFAYTLIASNNQKMDLQVNVIGMVCNVGLNLLLIPKFSYLGAGIATLVSICIFLVLQYFFIEKHLFKIKLIKIAWKPFFAASLMGMVMVVLRPMALPILIFVAVLIYTLLLLALKTFSQDDIQLINRIWKRGKGLRDASQPKPQQYNL